VKVYTGGTYDLFHWGHARFLMRSAKFGPVTVGLNTDEFVTLYRGRPPVWNYEQRKEVLLACRYVSEVLPQPDHNSRSNVLFSCAGLVTAGSDWGPEKYGTQTSLTNEWLGSMEVELMFLPYTKGISSTLLRDGSHAP